MNLKAVEQTYHWKPEDGDYPTKTWFDDDKSNFVKFLYKYRLFNFYRRILFTFLKYFA